MPCTCCCFIAPSASQLPCSWSAMRLAQCCSRAVREGTLPAAAAAAAVAVGGGGGMSGGAAIALDNRSTVRCRQQGAWDSPGQRLCRLQGAMHCLNAMCQAHGRRPRGAGGSETPALPCKSPQQQLQQPLTAGARCCHHTRSPHAHPSAQPAAPAGSPNPCRQRGGLSGRGWRGRPRSPPALPLLGSAADG